MAALATAEYVTGHPDVAAELAEAAIDAEERNSLASITLHRSLGQARRALGDLDGAIQAFRAGATIGHQLGMTAMALELDIAAALVTADLGDVDRAIAEVEAVLERAEAISSVHQHQLGADRARLDDAPPRPIGRTNRDRSGSR